MQHFITKSLLVTLVASCFVVTPTEAMFNSKKPKTPVQKAAAFMATDIAKFIGVAAVSLVVGALTGAAANNHSRHRAYAKHLKNTEDNILTSKKSVRRQLRTLSLVIGHKQLKI